MSSQNRMNAGAEYVLYRIWATLQEREGIHAESLLACVGALAGYACQAYVRRAGAKAGAAGATYLDSDALDQPLRTSPLSVWALVRRSLQKLGNPVPDIEDISAHVTRTLGTKEFGVPRAADGHRPRRLPIAYLTQLWPQVLPIAQRFCRRPAQLPVLFGIALQRALEHTTERLNPTIGASIAMESAVAMSKAILPAALSELFQPTPSAPVTLAAAVAVARKRAVRIDPETLQAGFFSTRMRSAKFVATLMSVAIVTITSVAWNAERREDTPVTARVEAKLNVRPLRAVAPSAFEQPTALAQRAPAPQAPADNEAPPEQETLPAPQSLQPSAEDTDLPAAQPDQGEGIIAEDSQSA